MATRAFRTGAGPAAAFDLLGRRWALRVLWELRGPVRSFRDLQSRCGGVSSSVLATRLAELREAGLLDAGYELTADGQRVTETLAAVAEWATPWHRRQQRRRGR